MQKETNENNYVYFMSFYVVNKNEINIGNLEITLRDEIKNIEQIKNAAEKIKEHGGYSQAPTILNYQLLRVEKRNG